MLAGAKRCRSTATLVDDVRKCSSEFPEQIGTNASINDAVKFLHFCSCPEQVDKLVNALTCNDDMAALANSVELTDAPAQLLKHAVASAQTIIQKYFEPALALTTSALLAAGDEQATHAMSYAAASFKGMWKIARACKAGECLHLSTNNFST